MIHEQFARFSATNGTTASLRLDHGFKLFDGDAVFFFQSSFTSAMFALGGLVVFLAASVIAWLAVRKSVTGLSVTHRKMLDGKNYLASQASFVRPRRLGWMFEKVSFPDSVIAAITAIFADALHFAIVVGLEIRGLFYLPTLAADLRKIILHPVICLSRVPGARPC
jgi:hypothetical protein